MCVGVCEFFKCVSVSMCGCQLWGVCVSVSVSVSVSVCLFVWLCVCVSLPVCVCERASVCVSLCVFVFFIFWFFVFLMFGSEYAFACLFFFVSIFWDEFCRLSVL